MTLLEWGKAKRKLQERFQPKHARTRRMGFRGNVHLTVVDRETGEVKRKERAKNTVTNVALLVDLINGTSADHLSSGANLRIEDSTPTEIKTLGTQRSGYPQAATTAGDLAVVTCGWEDLTADTYNPDDLYLESTGGVDVAETLNVAWADKQASENWFFDWSILLDGDVSGTGFVLGGLVHMLDVITGASTQHWDGTEGSANLSIKVYDGSPGSLEFTQAISEASTQPTSTQIRFTFTKVAGGSFTWARVVTENTAATEDLFDDDIPNQGQTPNDTFEYELTLTFS